MRTKFHIIIGGDSHEVDATDIKNWDEVKFTLERKDYSGVVRSFSSEFEFVGDAFKLLRDLYLAKGFKSAADVAVSTKNDDWTYTEQFRSPLDFSTLEIENETLKINAIDNSLASLIKSKKSTKYEFAMNELSVERGKVRRITLNNSVSFHVGDVQEKPNIIANVWSDEIFTTDYFEAADESSANSFFIKGNKYGRDLSVAFDLYVRCPLRGNWYAKDYGSNGETADDPVPYMQLLLQVDAGSGSPYGSWSQFICDNQVRGRMVGGTLDDVFGTLDELKAARPNPSQGDFGIVGEIGRASTQSYWDDNSVYEFDGTAWVNKGNPHDYYQDVHIDKTITIPKEYLGNGTHVGLFMTCTYEYGWEMPDSTFRAFWTDRLDGDLYCTVIRPQSLLQGIVSKICPGATATIDTADNELLANTYFLPGECIRNLSGAKAYSTFQNFADWMSAYFGYTYYIDGNELRFVARAGVFKDEVVKVIDDASDVKYSIEKKRDTCKTLCLAGAV